MSTCFVIMPITTPDSLIGQYANDKDHFKHVIDHLFLPAIKKLGFELISPSATGSDVIHSEIINQLELSDLVLCDISTLNPNVFFELGIRTALDKPVSIIKDNLTTKIPFDTHLVNHHTYDHTLSPWQLPTEIEQLYQHLLASINKSNNKNSLWQVFGLTSKGEIPIVDASGSSKLDFIIDMLKSGGSKPDSIKPPTENKAMLKLWFIEQAQDIAGTLNAKFEVIESKDKIILDLTGFMLTEDKKKEIMEIAQDNNLYVEIIGGDIKHILERRASVVKPKGKKVSKKQK